MPRAVLSPAGLKKPHALISRSLQIGERDRIQGRWKLLLLMDGPGRGEIGEREGVCVRVCVERLYPGDSRGGVAHLGPSLDSLLQQYPWAWFSV